MVRSSFTRRSGPLDLLERLGLVLLFAAMVVFFAVDGKSGSIFRSSLNVTSILGNNAVVGLIGLAMVLPLVAGYFDFSVAATAGIVNIAVAAAMSKHGWSPVAAILLGVAIGAAIGLINGYLVAKLRLDAFIVTFGVYILLTGIAQWYTKGNQITEGIPASFGTWGAGDWLGVPRPFVLLVVVAAAVWFVVAQTPFGRYLESIGSNESASRLVGIDTDRIIGTSFLAAGALGGVAGALLTSRQGGADAGTGASYLFPVVAAIFLGATTIRPGKYNVWGTVIGVYFVAVAESGLILLGADSWVQPVFGGAALVIAVALSTFSGRARARREERLRR